MLVTKRRVTRLGTDLAFASGETKSTHLPDDFLAASIVIFIDGAITVTGGSSSSSVVTEGAKTFIQSIRLIADGAHTVQSWTGQELFQFLTLMNGEQPHIVDPADLDTGTKNFELELELPFGQPRADLPPPPRFLEAGIASYEEVSYLPTWLYDQLELEIEWGTIADLSDEGGDRTETVSVDSLEIYERYVYPERLPDPVARNPQIFPRFETKRKESVVTAVTDDHRIEISRAKRRSLRALLLWTESDGVLVDTIINELRIEGDESKTVMSKVSWDALRASNRRVAKMSSAPDTGFALIDFAEEKDLAEIINLEDYGSLELVLDVAAPGTTDKIHVVEIAIQA